MGGCAKSEALKQIKAQQKDDALMARAVKAYLAKQAKPKGQVWKGLRTICNDYQQLYFEETGERIRLVHTRLMQLAEGGRTRQEASKCRSWLKPEEAEVVIEFLIKMASRGFPFSHRCLKEHVDLLCHGCEGFPEDGVGENWTHRFMNRHSDCLKMGNSRPLKDKRARTVNPTTNQEYWDILDDMVETYRITEATTFGVDEIGVQSRGSGTECVIMARSKKGVQHQQTAGTRENRTVIVTICADGTFTPPAVIFKGSAVTWGENNPLKASIGYQKKGWTDGEIGAEWIKIFDTATKHKVKPGEYRLLLVDGHNSHYTLAFILYSRDHLIIILCYPSHGTHVYEGLDVVIFSVLKRYLNEECDKWFRKSGTAMTKNNFLEIYSRAHVRAITPDNIRAAFRATGVWPFNPNVVTPAMIAPSMESSSKSQLPVPISDLATDALVSLFRTLAIINDEEKASKEGNTPDEEPTADSDSDLKATPDPNTQRQAAINKALVDLSKSDLASLFTTTHITHLNNMPQTSAEHIPHPPPLAPAIAVLKPETPREAMLLAALHEVQAQNKDLSQWNIALRGGNLLNGVYCRHTQSKLEAQDPKKKQTQQKGILDGSHPKLLTDDTFIDAVQKQDTRKKADAQEKERQKNARGTYQEAKAEWERSEVERKAAKERETAKYKKLVAAWEQAKSQAGAARKKFMVKKPKMGVVPKSKVKPKLKDFLDQDQEQSSSSLSSSNDNDNNNE